MQTELIDFWGNDPSGYLDSSGKDITKEFLLNLFGRIDGKDFSGCQIFSHFSNNSRITKVVKTVEHLKKKMSSDPLDKRLLMHGHVAHRYKLNDSNFNAWYTSENKRPPLSDQFHLYLSHDLDKYDGRNIYLPFWATRMGITVEDAISTQRSFQATKEIEPRNGICAIISNPEPIRMAYINQLSRIFPVDLYGSFGKPVTNKHEILAKYRVAICFENVESPGYVTEKTFDAWQAGCIPVWRGIDSAKTFNPEAIIDVTKLGFVESIQKISEIMKSDEIAREITHQPLLFKEYDYDSLLLRISESIS
jgi:hypothetical protein